LANREALFGQCTLIEEARGLGEFDMAEGEPGPVGSPSARIIPLRGRLRPLIVLAVILAIFALPQLLGRAAAQTNDARLRSGNVDLLTSVTLVQHKSRNLRLDVPFAVVEVADPDIADAHAVSDRQLFILGKKIGATNVLLYDTKRQLIGVVDVEVKLDTRSLGSKIREGSGGRGIRVNRRPAISSIPQHMEVGSEFASYNLAPDDLPDAFGVHSVHEPVRGAGGHRHFKRRCHRFECGASDPHSLAALFERYDDRDGWRKNRPRGCALQRRRKATGSDCTRDSIIRVYVWVRECVLARVWRGGWAVAWARNWGCARARAVRALWLNEPRPAA
jgi:hypothetical protein